MSAVYDSILFDFDGVLADTEPIHWACWNEILAPLEIKLSWETYSANCIGVQDRDMLWFLATQSPRAITVESLDPFYTRKRDLFRGRVIEANPCPPATVEFVRSLAEYRLAVVTSSGRREVEPVLERAGFLTPWSAMVFGEDVERHKPAPDPYLLAASRLGATRPLVVEDSTSGVASARAAGFDVLRVTSSSEMPGLVSEFLTRACGRE